MAALFRSGRLFAALLMTCALLGSVVLAPRAALASDAVCAEVRIEIRQKLNLERQAFDAVLRIRNGLTGSDIEALGVNILFQDAFGNPVAASSDPGQLGARFFVRLDSLEGVDAVDGSGTVPAGSLGVARWLIIPSADAGGESAAGLSYRVGARVTYRVGNEDRSVEVAPETITVRPQPRLQLDYFLAGDVYSDDPFTADVEPPEPFTFGVRVRNAGAGMGRKLRIESAQPRIVENRQGLLVDFRILGGRVDDAPASASLRLDLGDLEPGRSRMGRWLMQTSLSGQFVDIEATYTHADTLGGALTSLIEGDPRSHLLVGDVLVDLPGRDGVRDFLARDGDVLRVYESNSADTEVQDLSSAAAITAAGAIGRYTISLPTVSGMVYARLRDPTGGAGGVIQATRADGSALPSGNIWRSRSRDANLAWEHFIHVFDTRGGGSFSARTDQPSPESALAGRVYVDANGNGQRDPGEASLANAPLLLDGVAAGAAVQRSSLSQEDGSFSFTSLPAGTYSLAIGAVEGLVDGIHQAGAAGGLVGPANITGIPLGQSQSVDGYLFAKRVPVNQPRLADLQVSAPEGPANPEVGELVHLVFRATNRGPEGAIAESRLQLPEAFAIESVNVPFGQFDPNAGTWTHGSLSSGAEQVLSLSGRFSEAGAVRLSHALDLIGTEVSDPDASNNLALLDIEVEPAPGLQLRLDLARQSRVLLWSSCAPTAPVSCEQERRARWQAVLGPDADLLRIAADAAAFRRHLRLGETNTVLIDGPISELTQHISLDELGETLRRGSALLLSGQRDSAWAAIEARAGLPEPLTRPGASALVEFLDSDAFAAGAVEVQGPLLHFPEAGVRALARYPDGSPAVVGALDEVTRLLVAGFDLLPYLEAASMQARAQRVLAGLSDAARLPLDGNQPAALRVSVDRQSGAGELDLQVRWPDPLRLERVLPLPTSQSAMEVHWLRTLAAAELPFEALLELRAGTGPASPTVQASAGLGADSATSTIDLPILTVPERFEVARLALDAVSVSTPSHQQAVTRARAALQSAREAAESANPWASISHLLRVLRELDAISTGPSREAQRAASYALAAVAPAAAEAQPDSIFDDSFEARP